MFHPRGPTFWELARQALSSTERGYDQLAPKFDFTPFRTPDAVLARVAGRLRETSYDTALDVCCGTGAVLRMLRPLCRRRVVGIDRSAGMLEVARRESRSWPGTAAVDLVRGDVLEMPFGEQFDLAVCFGALGHILPRDEPRFVANVRRVLRPGGQFVFLTTTMPPYCSIEYVFSRTFNAAMHVRNWLIRPPFIMYYLTFLLPAALQLLASQGFHAQISDLTFERPHQRLQLVIATKVGHRG